MYIVKIVAIHYCFLLVLVGTDHHGIREDTSFCKAAIWTFQSPNTLELTQMSAKNGWDFNASRRPNDEKYNFNSLDAKWWLFCNYGHMPEPFFVSTI